MQKRHLSERYQIEITAHMGSTPYRVIFTYLPLYHQRYRVRMLPDLSTQILKILNVPGTELEHSWHNCVLRCCIRNYILHQFPCVCVKLIGDITDFGQVKKEG